MVRIGQCGYVPKVQLKGSSSAGQNRQTRSKSNPHCRGVRALPRAAASFAHVAPFVDGAELTDPNSPRWNR